MSGDEFSMTFPRVELQTAVKGQPKEQLEAIREYISRELEANLCNTCRNSRLRTGDQASLIRQLREVLAELNSINTSEEANRLASVRASFRLAGGTAAEQEPSSDPTGQRRTGSRRAGGGRWPAS